MLVTVTQPDSLIIVCGYSVKDALKHTLFYLDFNITSNYLLNRRSYVPPIDSQLFHVTDVAARGDECYGLSHISNGKHVLVIKTDPLFPEHMNSFSHVITY